MNPVTILKDAAAAGVNAAMAQIAGSLKAGGAGAAVGAAAEEVVSLTGSHSTTALIGVTVAAIAPAAVAFVEGFAASVAAATKPAPKPPAAA